MRNIRHEFFLIVFALCQFRSHIGKRCGKISHFIGGIHTEFVMQISFRILFGCGRDFLKRFVNYFIKEDQNDQGK